MGTDQSFVLSVLRPLDRNRLLGRKMGYGIKIPYHAAAPLAVQSLLWLCSG